MRRLFRHDFFVSPVWRGRPYLISPFADLMMAGALALLVFASLFAFFPPRLPPDETRKKALLGMLAALAFIVNDPHFMASYQLFYRGYRTKLARFRHRRELLARYLVAGIIVPLGLGMYFAYALYRQDMDLFIDIAMFMTVLVTWHYTKQGFGVFMLLSALKKIHYSPAQRLFLLINCYIVWAAATFILLTHPSHADPSLKDVFGGIPTTTGIRYVWLPKSVESAVGGMLMGGALLALLIMGWDHRKPSWTAILGYFSVYYFIFAASLHPLWIFFYPAFHSLQYLMFVYAYKRGEARLASARTARMIRVFFLMAIALGVLFFWAIPSALEYAINPRHTILLPLTGAFVIFINIHHYFLDNVIWRKEHAEIAQYLFYRPSP